VLFQQGVGPKDLLEDEEVFRSKEINRYYMWR